MAADKLDVRRVDTIVAKSVRAHWKFFLIEGIVLLLLGVIAVCAPPLATFAVEVFIGWLILISGVLGLLMTFQTRGSPGFVWSLLSALLGIMVGVVLLVWPLSGVLSLTVVLTIFLALEGIASIMYALAHRRDKSSRWQLMLVSGIVDLILVGMILAGLPGTAAWAIGLIVGINLLFGGVALIALGVQARTNTATPA